jgi:hypothetical protein
VIGAIDHDQCQMINFNHYEQKFDKIAAARYKRTKHEHFYDKELQPAMAISENAEVACAELSTYGTIQPAIPPQFNFLLADRPVLNDEDPTQYDTLLCAMVQHVKPINVIEVMWVKDIVDLNWEAKRLRRCRNQILYQARLEAVAALIVPAIKYENSKTDAVPCSPESRAAHLAFGWLSGDRGLTTNIEQMLQARGLTVADVSAKAFQLKLQDIERIDRMAASVEQRRDTLLREIERRRASFSLALRAAAVDVTDVEPSVIISSASVEPHG